LANQLAALRNTIDLQAQQLISKVDHQKELDTLNQVLAETENKLITHIDKQFAEAQARQNSFVNKQQMLVMIISIRLF
jgi:hypothetical protein